MAEDATLTSTLLNMIVTGCQMHANVFTLMGKGDPQFQLEGKHVLIALSDGTYKIEVSYFSTATSFAIEGKEAPTE